MQLAYWGKCMDVSSDSGRTLTVNGSFLQREKLRQKGTTRGNADGCMKFHTAWMIHLIWIPQCHSSSKRKVKTERDHSRKHW